MTKAKRPHTTHIKVKQENPFARKTFALMEELKGDIEKNGNHPLQAVSAYVKGERVFLDYFTVADTFVGEAIHGDDVFIQPMMAETLLIFLELQYENNRAYVD